jgi:hypothetical protein
MSRTRAIPTQKVEILVTGLAGPLYTRTLNINQTVAKLKRCMEKDIGLDYFGVQLVNGTRILCIQDDEDKIVDLMAERGSTGEPQLIIECVKRLPLQAEWLRRVANDPMSLADAPLEIKSDKEVVILAVKECGLLLQFVAKHLLKDRDVILAAVKNLGHAFTYASDTLHTDREIALTTVKQDGCLFINIAKEFQKDDEIARAALQQCNEQLAKLPDNEQIPRRLSLALSVILIVVFQSNPSIILTSLQENNRVLWLLPKMYQYDILKKSTAAGIDAKSYARKVLEKQEDTDLVRQRLVPTFNYR